MKSAILLLSGVTMGWLLHLFWSMEVVNPAGQGEPVAKHDNRDIQTGGAGEHLPSLNSGAASVTSESELQTAGVLLVGYDGNIESCLGDSDNRASCKQLLLQWVEGNVSKAEVISKLDAWLLEYPDDLEIGMLLVDAMIKDRRFMLAIEQLEKIKSYQFDVEAVEVLVSKVESLIRSSDRMFHDNGELDGLVSLYQILIEAQPANPRWRFELASVLRKTDQFDRALDMLSYILYDAGYGGKATALYQEISRLSNSPDQNDIPLIKNGSQFLVNAVINGSTPLRLLIDTGASITSIDKNILAGIGANNLSSRTGKLQTVNGTITTTLVELGSLGIGDFTIHNIEAAGIDSLGSDLDGLLGMDFLSRFKFSIDQDNQVLFLGDKKAQ